MQSSLTISPLAIAPNDAVHPLVVSPGFLVASFATVVDPRRRQGRRYPLAAILAVVAILSNCTSVLAIAQFGADAPPAMRQSLGFADGKTPRQSTVHRLFAKLNPNVLIAVLARACGRVVPRPKVRASQGVAIDGKAQDKAEAELTVTPEVIATVDWHNRVLTGDALFCQKKICRQVCEAQGDDLILVKANQGTLFNDIRLLFEDPDPSLPLTDRREATTVDNGHGRRADTRHLIASTDLVGYLDWTGHAQVFRYERNWTDKGTRHQAIRYGITSLPPQVADAKGLLAIKRAHWQIENQLHRPKDVTLDEDASLVHGGYGPASSRFSAISCSVSSTTPGSPPSPLNFAITAAIPTRPSNSSSTSHPRTQKP